MNTSVYRDFSEKKTKRRQGEKEKKISPSTQQLKKKHHKRTRRWTEMILDWVRLTFAQTFQSVTGIPVHRGQGGTSFLLEERKGSPSRTRSIGYTSEKPISIRLVTAASHSGSRVGPRRKCRWSISTDVITYHWRRHSPSVERFFQIICDLSCID